MSSGKITLEQRKASLHYHVQEYRKRRVIIDTDAACEADDPFAIAQALMSKMLEVKGICAEHFVAEGSMEQSYEMICRVTEAMGADVPVLRGQTGKMSEHQGEPMTEAQVVYAADKLDNYADIAKIGVGAAVIVTGTILETPGAKQPFEMQADEVVVEGTCGPDYPLQKKRHSFEYLRTIAHLRLDGLHALDSLAAAVLAAEAGSKRAGGWRDFRGENG